MQGTFDRVLAHAQRRPDKLALLSDTDDGLAYDQLIDGAARWGCVLRSELGLADGERICLWAWNRPDWVQAFIGASATGIPSVTANPQLTDDEMAYVVTHSGARVLVVDQALEARALGLAERVATLDRVVTLDPPQHPGSIGFAHLLSVAPSDPFRSLVRPTAAISNLAYTSGTTTGKPKAVRIVEGRNTVELYHTMFGLEPGHRAIVVTGFFHGNGRSGCLSALEAGASAVIPRRFSARRFWGLVDRFRPDYLFTLVQIVNILMALPVSPADREHSMRLMIALGCAPRMDDIERRYGVRAMDWYGMCEAGPGRGAYTRLDEPPRPGAVGRPFEGGGLWIMGEDGSPCPPGRVGEVVFDAATIGFSGYVDDEAATGAALRDGIFHTGDLGRLDEDGYFYFADRTKDIIRRGGENISSLEVEAVLGTIDGVEEAAVVAGPDPVLGERVVAFVVAPQGRTAPELDELRRRAGDRLATFKLPEDLVVVDSLPRTGTGKVEKFRLRATLRDAAAREGAGHV